MILKINDLEPRMSVIYKINYNNGKAYIGYTNDLKRRISEHRNAWKKAKYRKVTDCDLAIHEQGDISEIEILEFVSDLEMLPKREIFWISYFNAYESEDFYNNTRGGNSGDLFGENNTKAVFTNEEVYDIRKRRFLGQRKKDVYLDYSDRSFSTFEHVWLGRGYCDIGKEFIIKTNSISRQEYSSKANIGLRNGRAKVSYEEIIDIRNKFDNEKLKISEIAKQYPQYSVNTIRRIALRESFKDIE